MPEQNDINDQLELLKIYRKTLFVYLKQRAAIGVNNVPPSVVFGIEEARDHIAHIKQVLRNWRVAVEDLPIDTEPPQGLPVAASKPRPPDNAALIRELLNALGIAGAAFNAQIQLREPLVHMIIRRLGMSQHYEYEEFFRRFYGQLNDEERFIHQKIRVQTNTIWLANKRAAELTDQLPLAQELPSLQRLRQHLALWFSKYDTLFQHTAPMCLLYVGGEEQAPFPASIEQELQTYLAAPDAKR